MAFGSSNFVHESAVLQASGGATVLVETRDHDATIAALKVIAERRGLVVQYEKVAAGVKVTKGV